MQFDNLKTWIEISKANLQYNISEFRRLVGRKKIAAVVKANAYGHGLSEIVGIIKDKVDWFGVDSLEEAIEIRNIGITKPILVMGYIPSGVIRDAIKNNISFVIYNESIVKKIISLNLKESAKVHLKIETGLNRQGVNGSDLISLVNSIKKTNGKIIIEGVYTHFANIEDTMDPSYALKQLERFNQALALLKKHKVNPEIVHCAASAAALLFSNTHFSMIRLGISLYGLWPSRETKIAVSLRKDKVNLKPVLSWKSVIIQIKEINVGESVGYGRTWFASRQTKVAIIPVGYSDGFDRKLSNTGKVLINSKYTPIIGRVAMNMMMVDVTDIPSKVGDSVTLIGKSGTNSISAEEIAEKLGTINYEVIARINPLISRLVTK
jgi:alanine racemase